MAAFLRGLNHITFAVKDLRNSLEFYQNILGMSLEKDYESGAYLKLGNIWICLSVDKNASERPHPDYTHIAFDINPNDFEEFKTSLLKQGVMQWKENKSEGESFYFLDPDGHKLEIHVGTLETRLKSMEAL
jgi:catechol 2,3-dioxygenase-like lactoylglutathione lyase family enzyme